MTAVLRRVVPVAAALVVVAGSLAGSSAASAAAPFAAGPAARQLLLAQPLPPAAAASTCSDGQPPEASFAPSANASAGTIAGRTLVVGVSGDTRLLGARNSLTGGALEGFDIEMARTVARAIFPGVADIDSKITYRVITGSQRFPYVNKGGAATGGVDLVARAVTMNCDRWTNASSDRSAAFSAVYFQAEQRLLVRNDAVKNKVPESVTLADLATAKAKVCAPAGSTSLDRITPAKNADATGITPVAVPIHSDCLVLWQEGKVDAITGDDTILAGFAAQDRRAHITTQSLEPEPYGLAVAKTNKDLARFVNAALESPAGHAAWTTAYQKWLAPVLPGRTQPAPAYGRS
jgi:polar amino acid transport system substrate-binding protein